MNELPYHDRIVNNNYVFSIEQQYRQLVTYRTYEVHAFDVDTTHGTMGRLSQACGTMYWLRSGGVTH